MGGFGGRGSRARRCFGKTVVPPILSHPASPWTTSQSNTALCEVLETDLHDEKVFNIIAFWESDRITFTKPQVPFSQNIKFTFINKVLIKY